MQSQVQQIQVEPPENHLEALEDASHFEPLEDAIKTIRRVRYGYGSRVDFEFPTADDLRQMVENIPTKIKLLKLKKSTVDGRYFGAF